MSGFFVPHNLKTPLKGASGGPLAGLTAAVKDMYDIAGERAGGGNPDWLANTRPAATNAIAVDKILGAGATIIGKTICDEFFYSVAGVNAHYGTPANLRAPGRIPGGSSSGSAAATAAGACDFALGSDTGGSVRIPASFCGLYGMRTTHGRVDTKGCMDMAPSFDTIGWFANGPGVFRRVGDVLLGGEAVRANVGNLLIADDGFAEADEAVVKLLRSALDRMKGDLPKAEHVRLAPGGLDQWREAVRVIQAYEIWQVYGRFVEEKHPKFGPGVAERMKIASTVTKAQADAASARPRRRAGPPSQPDQAGHRGGAADRALDRAADRHAARGARCPPPAGDAADLLGRPCRTAADEPPRRHGFGLPGRALVDRLGGWRRSTAGHGLPAVTALRHCLAIVTLSPSLCLGFGVSRNCRSKPQVLTMV